MSNTGQGSAQYMSVISRNHDAFSRLIPHHCLNNSYDNPVRLEYHHCPDGKSEALRD